VCFLVDAIERKVCLMDREQMGSDDSRYFALEPINLLDYEKFGKEPPLEILDEDSDRYVHCDACDRYFIVSCLEHPLYLCNDRSDKGYEETDDRARRTLPGFLHISNSLIPNAGKGVFTKVDIPTGIVFGPYEGILRKDLKLADVDGYSWELRRGVDKASYYIDGHDPRYSNWMRFINSSRYEAEQNLLAFQYCGSVYYRVFKPIDRNAELLVWYGSSFGNSLLGVNTIQSSKERKMRKTKFVKNPYIF